MAGTPEATYPSTDPVVATLAELKKRLRDSRRLIALDGDGTAATLVSGELTVDFGENQGRGVVVINPETGVVDDITGINTGSETANEGAILICRVASGDTITFKNTGNIDIESDFDQKETGISPASVWFCNGTAWEMIAGAGDISLGASLYILQMNTAGDDYDFVDPKTVRGATTRFNLYNSTGYSNPGSSWRDAPGSSVSVDIPATATIIVTGVIGARAAAIGNHTYDLQGSIGGVLTGPVFQRGYQNTWEPIPFHFFKENVPVSTVTVLLREREQYAAAMNVDYITYSVLVIVE